MSQKIKSFFSSYYHIPFIIQVAFVILYRGCLDVIYVTILSPLFSYSYTQLTTHFVLTAYLCSVVTVIAAAPFVVRMVKEQTPSAMLLSLLNYMYFIPLTSYYGCKGTVDSGFYMIAVIYWALIILYQLKLPIVRLKPPSVHDLKKIYTAITVISCAFVVFISWKYTGLRFTLDFLDVYGIRDEAAKYSIPGWASYLLGMMPVILAVLLLYWMQQKKWSVSAVLIVVYLLLFSIAGNKSYFFMLFLTLASFFLYKKWMLNVLPGMFLLFNFAGIAEYAVRGSYMILSLFTRRMMYVPCALSHIYFEFFSENPVNLFREGLMSKLSFDSIYSQNIPRMIGEHFEEYAMNANNGLLGDMFANLPVCAGLILMPLIVVICLRVLDMAAKNVDERVLLPFSFYFAGSFMNASWSTVLLTHGFLVACIMLYFYPRSEKELADVENS